MPCTWHPWQTELLDGICLGTTLLKLCRWEPRGQVFQMFLLSSYLLAISNCCIESPMLQVLVICSSSTSSQPAEQYQRKNYLHRYNKNSALFVSFMTLAAKACTYQILVGVEACDRVPHVSRITGAAAPPSCRTWTAEIHVLQPLTLRSDMELWCPNDLL